MTLSPATVDTQTASTASFAESPLGSARYDGYRAIRLRDTMAALGTASLFMSQEEPFASFRLGPWIDTFKGQILRNHYFFTTFQGQVVGYCGWALTSREAAQDWIQDTRVLTFEECRDGPCVLVMSSRALTPTATKFYAHIVRAVVADRDVIYWKRPTDTGVSVVAYNLQADGVRRPSQPDLIETVGTNA